MKEQLTKIKNYTGLYAGKLRYPETMSSSEKKIAVVGLFAASAAINSVAYRYNGLNIGGLNIKSNLGSLPKVSVGAEGESISVMPFTQVVTHKLNHRNFNEPK